MYNVKCLKQKNKRARHARKCSYILVFSLLTLLLFAVGGTLAYLVTDTAPVENTFQPGEVTCTVTESFNKDNVDNIKRNVNVINTGSVDAYIRVRLVSYRVNDDEDIIGGTAKIPDFTPGEGWMKHGDHYYYNKPVAPGEQPETDLIDSITLSSYEMQFRDGEDETDPYGKISGDLDEGVQVIEVMAEAFQARGVDDNGDPAVETVWPVKVDEHGTLSLNTSSGLAE